MSKSPLKNISPLPSGLLEMNYAYDVIIRRELKDLTINYLVVSFGKSYYVDAALLRGENIYRTTRKEKTQNARRDARQITCARARASAWCRECGRSAWLYIYIHRGGRTCVDTCVSGDAVIDVAAHLFFSRLPVRSLFLSFFLSLSLFRSFPASFFSRSRLFHARGCAWARCHTRAGTGSWECNRPRASSCCSGSDSYNATAMRITRRIITAAPLSSRVAVPRLPALVSSETCVLYRRRVPRLECLDAAERCSRFCTPAKIMTEVRKRRRREMSMLWIAILRMKLSFLPSWR